MKDLASSDQSHKSSSRDLQSLWKIPLFVRDDDAAWRGELLRALGRAVYVPMPGVADLRPSIVRDDNARKAMVFFGPCAHD
jgi:hypothetical protein